MAFDLVEINYSVIHDNKVVMTGKCPTFFVNTLANLYLTFDNPSTNNYLEITSEGKVFKIYAPIL